MSLLQEKIQQAIGILRETGLDCWLTFVRESALTPDPALDFILGVPVTWHSAFLLGARGETIAIVGKYDRATVEETGGYAEVLDYVQGGRELLVDALRRLNPRTIAVNFSISSEVCDGLTHGMYLTLREWLEPAGFADRLVSAEPVISALRARKTPSELAAIREAITTAEEIYARAWTFMRVGTSEAEIATFMQSSALKCNAGLAWGKDTCPSVFAGPETAEAHYHPTERRLKEGQVVSMDFGTRVAGYCSDLQRTHYVLRRGESAPPPEVQHGFDTIVESIERARRSMRPGVRGKEVDAIARSFIVERGYAEFPHGLGHQVGRSVHDGTALLGPPWEKYGSKVEHPLETGMVFTLEPRLTVPGYGIVTIEEMVVVGRSGTEFLSTPQRTIRLIPAGSGRAATRRSPASPKRARTKREHPGRTRAQRGRTR